MEERIASASRRVMLLFYKSTIGDFGARHSSVFVSGLDQSNARQTAPKNSTVNGC